MRTIIAALFAEAVAVSPALASDKTDVWAAVRQYADAFTMGDAKAALDACAPQAFIIDDFPHLWQGATGCADWAKSEADWAKQNKITDEAVALGRPLRVEVTGDRAYAVAEANYAYKEKGNRKVLRGSIWTLVLQKSWDGWRIAGWAWADR